MAPEYARSPSSPWGAVRGVGSWIREMQGRACSCLVASSVWVQAGSPCRAASVAMASPQQCPVGWCPPASLPRHPQVSSHNSAAQKRASLRFWPRAERQEEEELRAPWLMGWVGERSPGLILWVVWGEREGVGTRAGRSHRLEERALRPPESSLLTSLCGGSGRVCLHVHRQSVLSTEPQGFSLELQATAWAGAGVRMDIQGPECRHGWGHLQ